MAQVLNSVGRVGSASRAKWFKKLEMFLTTFGAVFADAREMERKAYARYPFVDW